VAWEALRSCCVREDPEGLVVLESSGGKRAPVWPYSQVLAAAADLAMLSGDPSEAERLVDGLVPYARGDGYAPMPGTRRRYYDDNAWIGLALIQLHLQTGERRHLEHSRRILRFVAEGRTPEGGVRWVEGRRSLNTCSTAPAAQLALRVHLIDGDGESLTFGRRTLAWLDRTLGMPGGLYADHVDRHGVDETLWTYNQGAALGAHALLHRVTDDDEALRAARRTAAGSLRRFDHDRTWRHPPVFNAVWFRNLLALQSIERVPGLDDAIDRYLERAWSNGRDREAGLITEGGIGSYDGTPTIDASGLVQLFALQAWPQDRLHDIC